MPPHTEYQEVIEHLDTLNKQIRRQNSLGHMFIVGIVYGIGFFIGSVILATIAFGVFGPLLGKISWIQSAFNAGVSLTH